MVTVGGSLRFVSKEPHMLFAILNSRSTHKLVKLQPSPSRAGDWASLQQGGNYGREIMPAQWWHTTLPVDDRKTCHPRRGNSSQLYLRSSQWSQSKTTAAMPVCDESYPCPQQWQHQRNRVFIRQHNSRSACCTSSILWTATVRKIGCLVCWHCVMTDKMSKCFKLYLFICLDGAFHTYC